MHPRSTENWTIDDAKDVYGIDRWGNGYFSVNDEGHVSVHPQKDRNRSIDLRRLIDTLAARGLGGPVLLRFPEILRQRIGEIHQAFAMAREYAGYQGDYRCVYPIKVNQERHVVEDVFRFGRQHGFGLEAGSKAELLAVLSLVEDESTPVVCNGFKDATYIETIVRAQKLGLAVFPVVESVSELRLLIDCSARHGVRPVIGVRVKLASRGAGRWDSSVGPNSKFGLSATELMTAVSVLAEHGLLDCMKLLHFHAGSQMNDIRAVRDAIREGTRVYAELSRMGAGLEYLDVGGGLGIDYNGSQSNSEASINYTLHEYAYAVVRGIMKVCDDAGLPHPTILSESGRATIACSSLLVFNVLRVATAGKNVSLRRPESPLAPPLEALYEILENMSADDPAGTCRSADACRQEALKSFNDGALSLTERELAERLFWSVCHRARELAAGGGHQEEQERLDIMLADTYFCNFSVFQSLPDSWAIGQQFPILPVHRLNERPERRGVLADLTCDSDGKVDRFIDGRGTKSTLELHAPDGRPYYLAAFLVGAYQEILGDIHNLLGDTHAVHVTLGDDGQPEIETVLPGESTRELLRYVHFSSTRLNAGLGALVRQAAERGRIDQREQDETVRHFESALAGYTYLESPALAAAPAQPNHAQPAVDLSATLPLTLAAMTAQ